MRKPRSICPSTSTKKTKGKGKSDDPKGKGKAKGKDERCKENRVCLECNKLGHLRKDCSVFKKRMAEKGGNKERTDTTAAVQGATAAVQGAMIETWEYIEDHYVSAFGEAVIAAVQRPETHSCVDSGASRSACPFGDAPDVPAKGTALPLFSMDEVALEAESYRMRHCSADRASRSFRVCCCNLVGGAQHLHRSWPVTGASDGWAYLASRAARI